MTDDSGIKAPAPSGLDYPFEDVPKPGETIEIAPGMHWARMKMPSRLNHINIWLLEDGDGWTIVDTGLNDEGTQESFEKLFAGPMQGKPLKRLIVTHLHPDHVGLAGWLTRKFDAMLWMTRTDFLMCKMLVLDTGADIPHAAIEFYRRAGLPDDALDVYRKRFGGFGRGVYKLPASFRRIEDGEAIEIGGREWNVVVGRGHAPEHACLHCPELKVLISGDQVLPRITSNVSVFPTEPFGNPLKDWLDSCEDIRAKLPDDLLVCPAHNEPFYGLHKRLTDLIEGHEQNLSDLHEMLDEPKRAIDVFAALFKREITNEVMMMATGESISHLNLLIDRGAAERFTNEDGVTYYRQA
jgi:glyoxylase-like metal-dependent hydrolase (beta-lactamase superfamily II)